MQIDFEETVRAILEQVGEAAKEELREQGHSHKGRLEKSFEIEVISSKDGADGELSMNFYARFLNNGVPASRIPFGKKTGARTSKYIQALIQYFTEKGLPSKEAKNAAFATANKHKREGMPTRSSAKFSRNGRRKGFLDVVLANEERWMIERFITDSEEKVTLLFTNLFTDNDNIN